ncbi:MAG: hypothetical protein H7138_18835 [Myxococcales bacterium]|nr:hypothetical protein [Myxococcales bacterium]
MNIKSIIASLVLGSSSVALAAPSVSFQPAPAGSYTTESAATVHSSSDPAYSPMYRPSQQPSPQPSIHDPAYSPMYRPAPQPVHRGGWFHQGWRGAWSRPAYRQQPVVLASELSFNGQDRKFITVGAQAGSFRKLELNAAGGRTFIKQVYVQFTDGQEQVIRNLDRTLTRGGQLSVDLDGGRRAIRRIVVYGTEINNGWRRAPGAFTVTAV